MVLKMHQNTAFQKENSNFVIDWLIDWDNVLRPIWHTTGISETFFTVNLFWRSTELNFGRLCPILTPTLLIPLTVHPII